jgi:phosphate-selective porin OprO/OprP
MFDAVRGCAGRISALPALTLLLFMAQGLAQPPAEPRPAPVLMLPDGTPVVPSVLPYQAPPAFPPVPTTDAPPPAGAMILPGHTGATAEERLRALEQQNAALVQQLSDLYQGQQAVAARVNQLTVHEAPLDYTTPGQLGRPRQPGGDVVETGDAGLTRARVDLSQGVRLLSPDGRYRIEFHDMTQFEGRVFSPTSPDGAGAGGLHNNFDIPRQRLYFTGQVDQYFDFYNVINRGYGTLDLFDSYVNFKFDKSFNIRVGRTKTPYTYEYYKISEGDLIAPERSVFVGNLAPNREVGVMGYGRLFTERLEYAVGLFNGPHRSFQDFNNFKNPFLFVNTKPFLYGGSDLLRYLNVGGSVNYGRENEAQEPNALRTANDETTAAAVDNVSPTFLRFNNGINQLGDSAFWSGDVAWYYRSLTALAMYNGGFITYATTKRSGLHVPYEGGSVAVTFFVTGEEIVTRKEVEPLRPFDWRSPLQNPGAVELYSRVAYLTAGSTIFTAGLADPKQYSRSATVLDTGANWYVNRFVRVFLDWQYAAYGSPVKIGPGRFTNSTNTFWIRTQLYY